MALRARVCACAVGPKKLYRTWAEVENALALIRFLVSRCSRKGGNFGWNIRRISIGPGGGMLIIFCGFFSFSFRARRIANDERSCTNGGYHCVRGTPVPVPVPVYAAHTHTHTAPGKRLRHVAI